MKGTPSRPSACSSWTMRIWCGNSSSACCARRAIRPRSRRTARRRFEVAAKLESFDILVTDVMMPQMTGDELARRLRVTTPALKVLYLTGFSDRLFKEKVDALGGRGVSRQAVQREGTAAGGVAAPVRTFRSCRRNTSPKRYPPRVCISRCGSFRSRSCTGTKARRSPSARRSSRASVVARGPAAR